MAKFFKNKKMKIFASVILLSALQTPSHRSLDVGWPKRSRLSVALQVHVC